MNHLQARMLTGMARVLDILLSKHPARSGMGVMLGIFFSLLATVFSHKVALLYGIDLAAVQLWQWIAPGVLLAHIPTVIWYITRPPFADEIRVLTELIEKGTFSEVERRRHYRNLIEQIRKSYVVPERLAKKGYLARRRRTTSGS